MPADKALLRVIAIAIVISGVDAISGRVFQASPDPSTALALGAAAWASYRLAEGGQRRLAVVAGVLMWAVFIAAYVAWAALLVGWNRSVPWLPRSAAWLANFAMVALLASVAAQFAGGRASGSRTHQS
jgi:peptidoglycan/LPS O-acetylase OafA/YrhL